MKKVLTIWAMACILVCNSLHAQEEFVEPPANLLTKFPFQVLTGGVIILRAQFADFPDTLNFILDTGSGGISLDSLTAVYFNLHPVPSDKTIRGIAGIRQVSFVMDQKLKLPGLLVQHLNFHINDYGILTSVYGERIDGIIGFSFLSRYIVRLDYDNYQMYVYSQGTMKLPKGGYLFRPLINMLPVQSLRVRDNATISTRFLYDMGAGLNMMLSKDFVEDSSFISS
ncbi:MAG: retropepsin-like domain-containing protein, partial [Bacteroidetes bacterium]|nr:retropepsin-like domain-containing protein [Bacteroidota bacterium]